MSLAKYKLPYVYKKENNFFKIKKGEVLKLPRVKTNFIFLSPEF